MCNSVCTGILQVVAIFVIGALKGVLAVVILLGLIWLVRQHYWRIIRFAVPTGLILGYLIANEMLSDDYAAKYSAAALLVARGEAQLLPGGYVLPPPSPVIPMLMFVSLIASLFVWRHIRRSYEGVTLSKPPSSEGSLSE